MNVFSVRLAVCAFSLLFHFVSRADVSDSFELQAFGSLSGRIAFQSTINGLEQILILDLDARRVRPLLSDTGSNSEPAISPQGDLIAFISTRSGDPGLYIVDWSGEHIKKITGEDLLPSSPSWSPDGTQIVFASRVKKHADGPSNIFTIGLDGAGLTQITQFEGGNSSPSWSPDGKVIAYSTDRFWPGADVCTWNLAQRSENCLLTGSRAFVRPSWSHNGKMLAYSFGSVDATELGVLRLESTTKLTLSSSQKKIRDAAWSPDDRYLAFTAETGTKNVFNLFVTDLEDRAFPLLRSIYSIHGLSWSAVRTITLEAKRMRQLELSRPVVVIPTSTPTPTIAPESRSQPKLLREILGRPTGGHE